MSRVPAFCMNCGNMFASGFNVVGPAITITNSRSTCPKCGQMASILDGEYSGIADALTLATRTPLTAEHYSKVSEFRRMLEVGRDADPTGVVPPDVVDAAAAIDPGLGAAFKLLNKKRVGWAAALLVTAIALKQCSPSNVSVNFDFSQHTVVECKMPTRVEDTALYYPNRQQRQAPDAEID